MSYTSPRAFAKYVRFAIGTILLALSMQVAAVPFDQSASLVSLGELNRWCQSSSQEDQTVCTYYIGGVFEGLQLGGDVESAGKSFEQKHSGKLFCYPQDMTHAQMKSLITNAISGIVAKHPDQQNLPAVAVIAALIDNLYPCKPPG